MVIAVVNFVVLCLLLDSVVLDLYDPARWPHTGATSSLLLVLLALWPLWRRLEPRPIHSVRVIAALAGAIGTALVMACAAGHASERVYELALDAFFVVAVALLAEVGRGLLDERPRRGVPPSDRLPEMRALRRFAGAGRAAPPA